MATSGKHSFNLTVDELILKARDRIGGQWASKYSVSDAVSSLNLLLAELFNAGIPLSLYEEVTVTMNASVQRYSLGVSTLDIHEAVLRRTTNNQNQDLAMERLSHSQFLRLPTKSNTSRPTQFMVERDNDGITLRVWPLPENSTDEVIAYAMKRPEDVASLRDHIDLPWRYLPCIVAGLAWYISMTIDGANAEEEQILEAKRARLKAHWEQLRTETLGEDRERTSFHAVPGGLRR